MRSPKAMLTVCLTVLVALPIGFSLGKIDRDRDKHGEARECEPQAPQAVAAAGLDGKTLRRLLREELRAERALAENDVERANPPSDEAEAKTEQADEAMERADQLVEAALREKRWTRSDDLALRQLFASLDAEQVADLSSRLFPAMNRGEIKPLHLNQ